MTITRRLLLHLALGTSLVLAVVTALTYFLVYDALAARELQTIRTYVDERARREEARFFAIEANLRLVRGQFLARLAAPAAPDPLAAWDHWYKLYPDGAWRSHEHFNDARRHASMWAHREWIDTPAARREVLIAQALCDEMLPGWVDVFPSYYFQFHGPLNIGVDTAIPDWAWEMPADYEWRSQEWVQLALPATVPDPERVAWTGLLQDPYTPVAFVCVYLPILHEGRFLGSVGHNLSMESTLDGATRSEIPGASHFIFRRDGRLIAHPTLRTRILESEGRLRAAQSGDRIVARLHRLALDNASPSSRFSGYDAETDTHYSVAVLPGPDWFYVTTVPRDYLRGQAYASARAVLWTGLAALALLLVSAWLILRRLVGRPLAELSRATEAMSAGDLQARAALRRTDDLGTLAQSFNHMAARVAARENELRELNSALEARVAARTAELSRALEREKELGQLKGNFVSLVSHEFRTPLGVIHSAAEVLQRYHDRLAPEKRAHHLAMIARSSRALASLIEGVLLLGRVGDEHVRFHPAPLDLARTCAALVEEQLAATGSVCPIRLAASPEALAGARGDAEVLRHILGNLLANACKYSPPGAPVDLTVERHGPLARFTVADRGIGIPEADRARLFTTFTRGGNVGTRPGTGLGLVIVRRCVEIHGGTLHLASEVGVGTTVTVELPVFDVSTP